MRRARTPGQAGFTIIELLVTMLVTMIGLAAMFAVFSSTTRSTSSAREYQEALAEGEVALEELAASSIAELEATEGYAPITTTAWGPVDYHEGASVGATGVTYNRTVEAKALDDDLVWFRVHVGWISAGESDEDPDAHHEIAIETVRNRGEEPPR